MNNKTKISARPWLLLPLEIKSRELESKIFLSCVAAEKGFGVLLGRNGFNLNNEYPRGVYLDKSIGKHKDGFSKKQVDVLGNRLVSLDEEGVVYSSKEGFLKTRTSSATMELSSLVFTWGEEQAGIIKEKYPHFSDKIFITGSPRGDLWRPDMSFVYNDAVNKIKEKYGKSILIVSSFPAYNHANGKDFFAKQQIETGIYKTQEEVDKFRNSVEYIGKVFKAFTKLVSLVAENNRDYTVILRPHPADDLKSWRKMKKTWPKNVEVVLEGGVTPWVLASSVVIHSGSTVAIESFMLKKPTISYMPYHDGLFDVNLPDLLSQRVENVKEVLALIKKNLSSIYDMNNNKKNVLCNRYLNIKSEKYATERIVEYIKELDLPMESYELKKYGVIYRLRVGMRKIKRRLNDCTGENTFTHTYRMQKNPGISLSEVEGVIEALKEGLNRFSNVKCQKIEEDLFCFWYY